MMCEYMCVYMCATVCLVRNQRFGIGCLPALLHGFWGANSGCQASAAPTLPSEPSSGPKWTSLLAGWLTLVISKQSQRGRKITRSLRQAWAITARPARKQNVPGDTLNELQLTEKQRQLWQMWEVGNTMAHVFKIYVLTSDSETQIPPNTQRSRLFQWGTAHNRIRIPVEGQYVQAPPFSKSESLREGKFSAIYKVQCRVKKHCSEQQSQLCRSEPTPRQIGWLKATSRIKSTAKGCFLFGKQAAKLSVGNCHRQGIRQHCSWNVD